MMFQCPKLAGGEMLKFVTVFFFFWLRQEYNVYLLFKVFICFFAGSSLLHMGFL